MRIAPITTMLLLPALLAAPGQAQSDNTYDVPPVGGAFTNTSNWGAGTGPDTWANGTAVNGSIEFDTTGTNGTVTIGGIDLDYTGISGLATTDSANPVQLILAGSGLLSFDNGGGEIVINPQDGLTLQVATYFNGDVHLDTSGMTGGSIEELVVEAAMTVTGSNLRVTGGANGQNGVRFGEDAVLTMDGTITVGDDDEISLLSIEHAQSLDGAIALIINGPGALNPGESDLSTVVLGSSTIEEDQDFVFHGLSGNGFLETNRGIDPDNPFNTYDSNVTITGGGHSTFEGSLNIQGDFSVNGQGTHFVYRQQDQTDADGEPIDYTQQNVKLIDGDVNVSDGATFMVERFVATDGSTQVPSLFFDSLNVTGGGTFGGDAWIFLISGDEFSNLLNIEDGWLYGGNEDGQGQLRITGTAFNSTFGPNAGLKFTIDGDNFNTESSYFSFDSLSFWNLFGSKMNVNLIGESYVNTDREFTVIQSLYLLPDGEIFDTIRTFAPGNGAFSSLETNRVTRSIEIVDNFNGGPGLYSTSALVMTLGADYASPAGELGRMGGYLNGLIGGANADPEGWQADLLGYLDANASSNFSYQQALASTMPTTQFAAERATAETMFFDVQRQNLREIAIGSRGPGMVRTAGAPQLLASLQEENAVESATASSSRPDIIINPSTGAVSTSSTDSDVFHALFVDGYGSWSNMSGVAFTPGYTNDAWGVAGGWGIGLADGITVGVTAGFEESSISLKGNQAFGSSGDATMNSIRAAPFVSWSGVTGDTEQYAILSVGGAYNYGSGSRAVTPGGSSLIDRSLEIHGWEFDVMGAVGTRVPLGKTVALQPEASIRYSLLKNSGDETQANGGATTNYSGGNFQYVNSRLGVGLEWFGTPAFRTTTRVGYQAQYYNWGTATFDLGPGGTVSESPGSGTINQVYVGVQFEWVPSWNTSVNVSFNGAYGDSTQNSISGGLMFRF